MLYFWIFVLYISGFGRFYMIEALCFVPCIFVKKESLRHWKKAQGFVVLLDFNLFLGILRSM